MTFEGPARFPSRSPIAHINMPIDRPTTERERHVSDTRTAQERADRGPESLSDNVVDNLDPGAPDSARWARRAKEFGSGCGAKWSSDVSSV